MKPGWVLKESYWLPSADPYVKGIGVGKALKNIVLENVKTWDCMVDGGAHVGAWSVAFADKFKKVVAVELAPDMSECLAENVRNFPNVEVVNAALSDKDAMVGWAPDDRPLSTVRRVTEGDSVRTLRIDALDLPSLGLLKLDLQGYDYFALNGARSTLRRCRPVVVFEWKDRCAKRYGVQKNQIPDLLTELGAKQILVRHLDNVWAFP